MATPETHDLLIIGAGPAGLSAAITAESERIDTLVLDSSHKLGGQAGTSSLIENYAGFPDGISGDELTARFVDQALKFTTEFEAPIRVTGLGATDEGVRIHGDSNQEFIGRAALLSSGVEYRLLRARNLAAYLGRGATYGSPNRKETYHSKEVVVVGGANSAGQAAAHLASFNACNVHMLIRGESLEKGMSGYLIDKLKEKDNIHVHTGSELVGVDGNGRLQEISVRRDGEVYQMQADEVFILIGSAPKTAWLPAEIARDKHGFVMAGGDIPLDVRNAFEERTGRSPFAHETSLPGLFVAGDVRYGTNKRVALAAGDGAAVVPELHRLRDLQRSNK